MVACRVDCRAGRATLTTVLSMNAMLEPRMVAASTHGLAFSAHGLLEAPDWITASSHGCRIILAFPDHAANPPSISKEAPVIYPASGPARYAVMAATSSACP